MPLIVLNKCVVSPADFVAFWQPRYSYSDRTYRENISLRTPESLLALFQWKIGAWLYESNKEHVNKCFISRIDEWKSLPPDTGAAEFLEQIFKTGVPIWRIFWLHCWNQRFPIYDQHVHRAMVYVQTGKIEELPETDAPKIDSYLEAYLPFYDEHFKEIDVPRRADQALWAFGKFMKTWEKTRVPATDEN